MASLVDQLENELGPDPSAAAPRKTGNAEVSGDGLFTRANGIDTVAVLDWLGIAHDTTPRGVMAQCPGCQEEGALVGECGGLKCLHDRCAPYGVPKKSGFRTNADIVALVRGVTPTEAAKLICERFGVDRQRQSQPRAQSREQEPEEPDYVPSGPDNDAPEREPGDDSEEIEQAKKTATELYGLLSVQDLLAMTYEELKKEKPRRGVPTGNAEVDAAIGGFRHGNITVLGAKRSFGKTSFSINAADTAIVENYRVVLLAGEDSAMMYGKRWMARRAGLNAMRVRDLDTSRAELTAAATALAEAPNAPFFLRVAGRSVEWMCRALRELRKEGSIDLVIADYLQCLKADKRSQDRRNEVTYVTQELVTVIREIGAAGLLLSQLKRTERVRPEIEDLKESGDIEDKADHVLLGFKEDQGEHLPAKRMLIVAKNKDGVDEIDDIEIPFDIRTASFLSTKQPPKDEGYEWADVGQDPYAEDWRNR